MSNRPDQNPPEGVLSLDPGTFKPEVQQLQSQLNALGYKGSTQKPLVADGKFGPNTLYAVNAFKAANKLGNTGASQGKVGPQTWKALFSPDALNAAGVRVGGGGSSAASSKKLVYYNQEDARWRNLLYSNRRDASQTVGTSGCGPTCAAMAISTLTGKALLPPVLAKFAVDNGFRTMDSGTAWGFFGKIAPVHGVRCVQTSDWEDAKHALAQDGHLVIASMRPGHFTLGGHYILLHGIIKRSMDAWIEVLDPNMDNTRYGHDDLVDEGTKDDGRVTARESLFRREAGQFWVFSN
ncbi:Peptidoglycan-binding domain 1 protein [Paenibacillus curdlanolyticus YK9]|uniref:Peptidoglycan-binding domain 1 protein n=1 Tax=Paenibacillus curdlanolyticus YK9 TaxID=717606 RepID=E0I811_9BACL|nr:peptidoglycan-binding protein [Paenibacillus curdlanolyticus]EFM11316.1 Peptidoglycan-binding domain 1 protein [Paenibacillus curdlanolyticus YK9]